MLKSKLKFWEKVRYSDPTIEVIENTVNDTLTVSTTRYMSDYPIQIYVENSNNHYKKQLNSGSFEIDLSTANCVEISRTNDLKYYYHNDYSGENNYILLTENQYQKASFMSSEFSPEIPDHMTVNTINSTEADIQSTADDVIVEVSGIANNTNANSLYIEFESDYANIQIESFNNSIEDVYDFRSMEPKSPINVSLPNNFRGELQIRNDTIAEDVDKATIPVSDIYYKVRLNHNHKNAEINPTHSEITANRDGYEPVSKRVDLKDTTEVTFNNDEFSEYGTLIFAASDMIKPPSVSANEYEKVSRMSTQSVSEKEVKELTGEGLQSLADHPVNPDDIYKISNVPTNQPLTIHYSPNMTIPMEPRLVRGVQIETPGDVEVCTVDITYKKPTISLVNKSDSELYVQSDTFEDTSIDVHDTEHIRLVEEYKEEEIECQITRTDLDSNNPESITLQPTTDARVILNITNDTVVEETRL